MSTKKPPNKPERHLRVETPSHSKMITTTPTGVSPTEYISFSALPVYVRNLHQVAIEGKADKYIHSRAAGFLIKDPDRCFLPELGMEVEQVFLVYGEPHD